MNWNIILWIIGILLIYPFGILVNLTTPLVQDWLARWSVRSLANRIARLEGDLAELERDPPLTEVEDELLWGIKNLKISVLGAANGVIYVFYMGLRAVSNTATKEFHEFSAFVGCVLTLNFIMQIRLRRSKDFRLKRSPRTRKSLRTAIDDLKKIQDSRK